jgi:hypothetical protein
MILMTCEVCQVPFTSLSFFYSYSLDTKCQPGGPTEYISNVCNDKYRTITLSHVRQGGPIEYISNVCNDKYRTITLSHVRQVVQQSIYQMSVMINIEQ